MLFNYVNSGMHQYGLNHSIWTMEVNELIWDPLHYVEDYLSHVRHYIFCIYSCNSKHKIGIGKGLRRCDRNNFLRG
jgi:hypothetical protein